MLTDRGILVKVNSVLIPGVNDEHLKEVSKIVKAKGAFLHNVMPLIAEAEHGTYYGIMEQPEPTPEQLQDLQDACAGDMAMMRHCRQCRADAVGLLGEDRGDEFTMDKIDVMEVDYEAAMVRRKVVHDEIIEKLDAKRGIVKPKAEESGIPADARPVLMAVAGKNGVVAEHFGHAKEFLIYEASPAGVRFMSHRKTELYCGGMDACGDGDMVDAGATESLLDRNIRILEGCEVVLCSKVGFEPWAKLEAAGIAPNGEHAMEPIEDAVMAVYKEIAATGKLSPAAEDRKVA
jgi:nitrogen fixation protein NifB